MKRGEAPARQRKGLGSRLLYAGLVLGLWCVRAAGAAGEPQGSMEYRAAVLDSARVVVDGRVILEVRGTSAFPALQRADKIRKAIITVADDDKLPPGDIRF